MPYHRHIMCPCASLLVKSKVSQFPCFGLRMFNTVKYLTITQRIIIKCLIRNYPNITSVRIIIIWVKTVKKKDCKRLKKWEHSICFELTKTVYYPFCFVFFNVKHYSSTNSVILGICQVAYGTLAWTFTLSLKVACCVTLRLKGCSPPGIVSRLVSDWACQTLSLYLRAALLDKCPHHNDDRR